MTGEPTPGKRADAKKNRARILEVAREALAETNDLPSMAEISRRADIGMATLYRNFPNKLDLAEELYRSQVDDICESARTARGDTPGEVFFAWLDGFHAAGARKGPLATLLIANSAGGAVVGESRARVIEAGQSLLDEATERGEIRDDVALGQILDSIVALERVREDPASTTSVIQVFLDGLRC
jgi:AcrR family transcriptional regulator